VKQYLDEKKPYVVRFKVPDEGTNTVHDQVRGEVTIDATELDDFVIRKADGYPTYHFAVVVDDELMGVTHVIRADEHLKNTHKHILLQEALGFRQPVFAHISVISNPDGSKMSKRDKDKALRAAIKSDSEPLLLEGYDAPRRVMVKEWLADKNAQLELHEQIVIARKYGLTLPEIEVSDLKRAGYLPEALINYLALLGWNPGGDMEKFDAAFLIEHFDFDRVQKSAAKFDRDKLLAFNHDALQALSADDFEHRLRVHWQEYWTKVYEIFLRERGDEAFSIFARANQARCKTLDDNVNESVFFLDPDDKIQYQPTKAVRKALLNGKPNGYAHLEAIAPTLREIPDWSPDAIDNALRTYADAHADGKLGKVAQPLRIAVSGGTISPDINSTLAILGKESVLNRIKHCLNNREMFTQPS